MTYTRLATFMTMLCGIIIAYLLASAFIQWALPEYKDAPRYIVFILILPFLFMRHMRILAAHLHEWFGDLLRHAGKPIAEWLEDAPARNVAIGIIAISAVSLFLELALIRWQASLFPVFALYKNFTLLACFCGLGIGYAMTHEKQLYLPLSLPMLALTTTSLSFLRYVSNEKISGHLSVVPVREETWVATFAPFQGGPLLQALHDLPVFFLLVVTFILNVLTVLPVAQFCGKLMQRSEPLSGYGLNLLGSIGGVALLFLLSWLWIGPAAWFGLSGLLLMWYLLPAKPARLPAMVSLVIIFLVTLWPFEPLVQNIYSPYQLIQKTAKVSDGRMAILSAGSYYQKVYDLGFNNPEREKSLRKTVGYYELPFRTANPVGTVAIVGAGSGNDAAAALRLGAAEVYAVEIDPAIRALGAIYHPEHPYQNPRAHIIVNDARTFFRKTDREFDTIVYAVLDSHILLSHGSNVRLDSFVYTQEGLRDAYARLKPGGLMSLSFALPNDVMGHKIYRMLKNLQDSGPPTAVLTGYDNNNTTTFMVRKGEAPLTLPDQFLASHGLTVKTNAYVSQMNMAVDLPTDDWPFFYMSHKTYPASYVVSLLLIMALAAELVRQFLPGRAWDATLLPFFFLGAGFMLVETKAITELGLLFGNTWQVIGIAIIGVLLMGFLANLAVVKLRPRKVIIPYVLLLAFIGIGYIVAIHGGLPVGSGAFGRLSMLLLLIGPLAFSGIAFSILLDARKDVPKAMSYNLMGAMLGGLLEYNSMQFGFAALYLIAILLYAAAWATTRVRLR